MNIEEKFVETIVQLKEIIKTLQDNLSQESNFNNLQRHKVTSSGYDIAYFSSIFMAVHKKAKRLWSDEEKLMNKLGPLEFSKIRMGMRTDYQNELATVYKALFYFVRAYQDTLYGTLLVLDGQSVGPFTSMQSCVGKKENKYRNKINLAIPEYIDWFSRWREKRNRIKSGVSCSLAKPANQLGVIFNIVKGKENAIVSDLKSVVTLKDAVEAIKMSYKLAKYINSIATKSS